MTKVLSDEEKAKRSAARAAAREATTRKALERFPSMPDDALVAGRIIDALFNMSIATRWRKIGTGELPKPVKPGRWRVGDVRAQMKAPQPSNDTGRRARDAAAAQRVAVTSAPT